MTREEKIKRGAAIDNLVAVVEGHVGADKADEMAREIADLLETAGKLLLPYHHVAVKTEVLPL